MIYLYFLKKTLQGSSNLKIMVDKILSKDKNYNSGVTKVTEKEIKIEILKKDIAALEKDYRKIKNDCNTKFSYNRFS